MQLTRRKLLGTIGIGTLGVGVLGGHGGPEFSHYTYAATGDLDDRRVRVAWYERYNGDFRENQAGTTASLDETLDPDQAPAYVTEATYVTDASGPVLSVGDVLPGDEGVLVVGLEAVADADFVPEPVDVWFRATVTGDDESGINGPEAAAGDTTVDDGELDEELLVEGWKDGSPLGSCDGTKQFDEDLEGPLVARAPLSEAFGATSDAGSATGLLGLTGLDPGQSRCVALAWTFTYDAATNRSQGDSVAFDVAFGAVPVDSESPFTEER
ncbi:hypothetical protein [Halorientalis marina]|uniref:hypothetical protein n=1 Tax=Halorientalis marina TaxID=2931976 RepID=UPI001FF2C787|nr:hypothetical protein [Halorientalis marina]